MQGIELNLTPTFQKSLAKLNKQEQNVVSHAVMSFWMNPSAPGLRFHSLNFREPRFHSISPNMDLRVIVLRDGARHVMMYVDHHDRAYAWAERRKVEKHPSTGSAQIVEFEEVVREEIVYVKREIAAPPLFAQEDDGYLLSLGVPKAYLAAVKQVDEDGLLHLCARLPEEAQEALIELAAGGRPTKATPAQSDMLADPFTHPDARRRFWVAPNEDALAAALERPWAEWLVFLHPSQRAAVERVFDGPARISGSAGTGKSIVSMHRAAHLARSARDDELVLLTSFSKILASRLADGVNQILGKETAARRRLAVTNLHAYAHGLLADSGRKFEIIQRHQLLALLAKHRNGLDRDKFSDAFVEAEWNAVIDYWGLESWEDYEKVIRAGRGTALPAQHRRQLWHTFFQVRSALKNDNLLSWGDLCEEARRLVETSGTKPFRHVVVDESQDLGPRELRLLVSLTRPGPQSLFFAGDMGQLIYRYPFSWLSVGVDVRGRSQRLKVNYRTSEQIQHFADSLVGERLVDADEPAGDQSTMSPLKGPEPEIIGGNGSEVEREVLQNWIKGLLDGGFAPEEIAIFARTKSLIERQATPVAESLGLKEARLSTDTGAARGFLNTGTLHAAKGLEFRAVAILGCDEGTIPLQTALDAEYEEEAKAIALARERQLLYVGCTRARERLLVTYARTPSRFLSSQKARIDLESAH